VWFLRKV